MTDTATRQAGANQFCGSCGAPVKVYWNSCAQCQAPIGVTPVGSYDTAATQVIPVATPDPAPTATPTPTGARATAPSLVSTFPTWTPPPRRSYASAPPGLARSSSAPEPSVVVPPPSAPSPAPSYTPAASYASPLADYRPPADWSTTAQMPAAAGPADAAPSNAAPSYGAPASGPQSFGAPSYGASASGTPSYGAPASGTPSYGTQTYGAPSYGAPANIAPAPYSSPSYQRDEPAKRSKAGSTGPWMIIAIVLAVLFLGSAVFAGVSASGLSSKNTKLKTANGQVTKLTGELTQANSALTALKASDSSTIANDSSEIAAYKLCVSDLSAADAAVAAQNLGQFKTANAALVKDCVPLGLT
jgi:hypothetical protein